MSILLSLQAVGAQTAEQMPDLTAVTAPTEAEINVIDLAFKGDRKSTRLNSSHYQQSRMPSSA